MREHLCFTLWLILKKWKFQEPDVANNAFSNMLYAICSYIFYFIGYCFYVLCHKYTLFLRQYKM